MRGLAIDSPPGIVSLVRAGAFVGTRSVLPSSWIVGNREVDPVVSMNTIRIRLGHESLDVTLAYLKGKDAESEEAQEHANSSSLAMYA